MGLGAILIGHIFPISECRHRNADYATNLLFYVLMSFGFVSFFIYIALMASNAVFALLGASLMALAGAVSIYYVTKKCSEDHV
jgi:ABC-type multidrug transport system permease subunit